MQTHRDDDVPEGYLSDLRKVIGEVINGSPADLLKNKARVMMAAGESQITAGKPGEAKIFERTIGRITVKKLPDDPLCTRVSVGGVPGDYRTNYLVFRGATDDVRRLLREATDALGEIK